MRAHNYICDGHVGRYMHEYRDGCPTCDHNYEGGVLDGMYILHRALVLAWMDTNPQDRDEMHTVYNVVFKQVLDRQKEAYAQTQVVEE